MTTSPFPLIRKSFRKFLLSIARFKPQNDRRIVFSSFSGRTYSDNPKYLYEYLRLNYPQMEFVWALRDTTTQIPGPAIKVKYGGRQHLSLLLTSSYWISNARIPANVPKPKTCTYLQTWHGTPLKLLGFDISEPAYAGDNFKDTLRREVETWDILLSPNAHSTSCFKTAFQVSPHMICELGSPRNDVLFAANRDQLASQVRTNLKLDATQKVVLYAPTWRDNSKQSPGVYGFELRLDLERLHEALGPDVILLLRMHYHSKNALNGIPLPAYAVDVSEYEDIQELYLITDVLVTDYSSTMFDFAILKRPIVLFHDDAQEYSDVRGFYFDIHQLPPGPITHTQEKLETTLRQVLDTPEQFVEPYSEFRERFTQHEDGHASRRAIDALFTARFK